jgi:hypothetical protein
MITIGYSKFTMTVACAAGSFALAGDDVAWKLGELLDIRDREVAGQRGAGGLDTPQKTTIRALTVAMASLRAASLSTRACTMLAPSWSTSKVRSVRPNGVGIWLSRKRQDGGAELGFLKV